MANNNFVLNGKTYTNPGNGYYWVTDETGKKSRISRATFVEAWDKYLNWTTEVAKAVVAETAEEPTEAHESAQPVGETSSTTSAPRAEEKPKKSPRRAKKNAAYTGHGITLTEKQVDFIRHLPDTCFWENGLDSAIWVDCLCDEITGQFENKPMTVGAMISTICEKGLGNRATDRINGRKAVSFRLTELGKAVAKDLGL